MYSAEAPVQRDVLPQSTLIFDNAHIEGIYPTSCIPWLLMKEVHILQIFNMLFFQFKPRLQRRATYMLMTEILKSLFPPS